VPQKKLKDYLLFSFFFKISFFFPWHIWN